MLLQAAEDPSLANELWCYAEQLTGFTSHPALLWSGATSAPTQPLHHQGMQPSPSISH